jgi:hypothetical protein
MRITITHRDGTVYHVSVEAPDGSTSSHLVTVSAADLQRFAPHASPEGLLDASFRFLLEREPKESILGRFDLPVIERYFPEYRRVIGSML